MNPERKIKIGKFISLILRHEPQIIGLTLDEAGWASVEALLAGLAQKGRALSFEELVELVETNDKQRYRFNADRTCIRASQGHSLTLDLQLEPQIPPPVLYHGTATRFLDSILAQGLQKQSRQHVHLSTERDTARKVGQRHGKPVILVVDAAAMQRDGCIFYCSDNGVWLTDTVAPRYINAELT